MDEKIIPGGLTDPISSSLVFDQVIKWALDNDADELFLTENWVPTIEIRKRKYPISLRKTHKGELISLLDSIYGPSASSQLGTDVPVDRRYEYRVGRSKPIGFRLNATTGLCNGKSVRITLRKIPSVIPSVDSLGLSSSLVEYINELDQGAVWFVGGTGQGKSTSMAAILAHRLAQEGRFENLITVESPIEFTYDNVEIADSIYFQMAVGDNADAKTFSSGVEDCLRKKPTIIQVGEARDLPTIEAAILAAMTGHLVFTTAHANDTSTAIRRLVSVFPDESRQSMMVDLFDNSRCFIAQRLYPRADGEGLVAVRERFDITDRIADILMDSDPRKIGKSAQSALFEYGTPMVRDAERLHSEGVLSDQTLSKIRANYKGLSL